MHALLRILSFFPTLHAVNRSCTFLSFSKKYYPALLLYPAHFEMGLKEGLIYNLSGSKYLLDVKREVSIQIPGTAFRGVLAVFEVHSRNLVGMELLDHFQSLRGQTCKFWPLRGQNGVK